MGTPDALRLSRLDRLINQLGEHQLTIRQQGTSVTDLDERLRGLEKRWADEMQALWPLREVDVQGELTAARASIDKLGKQLALLSHDQEEGRIQSEKRLQQVEARQADLERQLAALAAHADAAAGETAAAVEELRQATKGMLSEVIGRIADQFDALQAALEEAIGGRAAEAEERVAAAAVVQEQLEAQRAWLEERNAALQQQVEARLEASTAAAARAAEAQQQQMQEQFQELAAAAQRDASELRAGLQAAQHQLEEVQQQHAEQAAQLEQQADRLAALGAAQQSAAAAQNAAQQQLETLQSGREADQQAAAASAEALQQRVAALAEEQAAAAAHQANAEEVMRQALTVWQQGVEEQYGRLEARLAGQVAAAQAAQKQLAARFEEYKGYVKRLRRQLAETRSEQEANTAHIAAVRQTFDGTQSKLDRLHGEAAALGGELMETTAAAATAGRTLRQVSQHVL